MSDTFRMACGCAWPVVGPPPTPGALPLLDIDLDRLPEGCKATWDMLGRGLTKGVFQLESNLGRHWCKVLKPESIEHMGALGAVLRPGCLAVRDEAGQSVTEKYCLRKNGLQEPTPVHPALADVLAPTYGLMLYQEQMMEIMRVLADFNLVEQDRGRKAAGKKSMAEMDAVGRLFVERAAAKGVVSKEMAEAIFADIKKSGRYLFNKSHAISYGIKGFKSAYLKAHATAAFFAGWLLHAHDKNDPRQEILELASEAKLFDVAVEPPDARSLRPRISTDGVRVRFGLADVKGVGLAQVQKLRAGAAEADAVLKKPLAAFTWPEFLFNCAGAVSATAMKGWIQAGAMRWAGGSRVRQEKEYQAWAELTKPEKAWLAQHGSGYATTVDALRALGRTKKEGGGCANAKRAMLVASQATLLASQASSDYDHPNLIAAMEEATLGVAITACRVDACDDSMVNCSCKDFLAGRTGKLFLGVEIKAVRVIKTKKKQEPMAFLSVSDASCVLDDVVVFPEAYARFKDLLTERNTVLIEGGRDPKKGGLICDKIFQL